jgi:hypothetical protein
MGKIMNQATAAILDYDFCSPSEVRQIHRTGRNATYNAIKSGNIPSFRIGGVIKVRSAVSSQQQTGVLRQEAAPMDDAYCASQGCDGRNN